MNREKNRSKRDVSQRAYKLGFNQGLKGHAKERCPFQEMERRGQWMGGWRQGHASYVAGYIDPVMIYQNG